MRYKITTIAFGAMVFVSGYAQAELINDSMFQFSGFGTVGVAHSSENQAVFNASALQRNGTGRYDSVSYDVDTRLGGQVTANFTDKLSAVVQVVTEQRADNTWTPSVEWANVKYQFNDDFSVRVGRIALPSLLYLNSRKVGLTLPLVRAPLETYRNSIISSNDGIDINYRSHFGAVTNTVTVYYGSRNLALPNGAPSSDTNSIKLKGTEGITDIVEFEDFMVRASYMRTKVTLGRLTPLMASPVPALAAIGKLGDNQPSTTTGLAASYDPGNWFVIGEVSHSASASGGKYLSHYLIGGYRYGDFTPYANYAVGKQLEAPALPGFAPLDQTTLAVGVRWDFRKSADLKLQFDRVSADKVRGLLINPTPTYRPGGNTYVASAAVDFMF